MLFDSLFFLRRRRGLLPFFADWLVVAGLYAVPPAVVTEPVIADRMTSPIAVACMLPFMEASNSDGIADDPCSAVEAIVDAAYFADETDSGHLDVFFGNAESDFDDRLRGRYDYGRCRWHDDYRRCECDAAILVNHTARRQ